MCTFTARANYVGAGVKLPQYAIGARAMRPCSPRRETKSEHAQTASAGASPANGTNWLEIGGPARAPTISAGTAEARGHSLERRVESLRSATALPRKHAPVWLPGSIPQACLWRARIRGRQRNIGRPHPRRAPLSAHVGPAADGRERSGRRPARAGRRLQRSRWAPGADAPGRAGMARRLEVR